MLKLQERNVPYCQIKKTYDDVVSPIFEPPGRKDDVDILVKYSYLKSTGAIWTSVHTETLLISKKVE